ncbi:MAG: bphP [Belnapia sp.]|nr:bphP [Belnapia sp.]
MPDFAFPVTDLTERKAADAARRRFQDGILQEQRPQPRPLDTAADRVFRDLVASVVENSQMAALEIVGVGRIPQLLESVRASAARTAAVLEQVLRHAATPAGREIG